MINTTSTKASNNQGFLTKSTGTCKSTVNTSVDQAYKGMNLCVFSAFQRLMRQMFSKKSLDQDILTALIQSRGSASPSCPSSNISSRGLHKTQTHLRILNWQLLTLNITIWYRNLVQSKFRRVFCTEFYRCVLTS